MTVLLLILSILPLIAGILIKVLYVPASEGIDISGAHIFFTIDLPLGGLPITESQVNSWLVILSLFFFQPRHKCTGLSLHPGLSR